MKTKKQEYPKSVEVEGAKGGSYVRFEKSEKDGFIFVEVGHSCVRTVQCEMPVTWLAAILTHASDVGFTNAMGDAALFPADYALMCDPATT